HLPLACQARESLADTRDVLTIPVCRAFTQGISASLVGENSLQSPQAVALRGARPPSQASASGSGARPKIEADDAAQDQVPLVQAQTILQLNARVDEQLNQDFDPQPDRGQQRDPRQDVLKPGSGPQLPAEQPIQEDAQEKSNENDQRQIRLLQKLLLQVQHVFQVPVEVVAVAEDAQEADDDECPQRAARQEQGRSRAGGGTGDAMPVSGKEVPEDQEHQ